MNYEIIVIVGLIYFGCLTAWNSLYRITRGRIRLMEEKDEELAEKMEEWRDLQADYNVAFHVIFLITLPIISITFFRIIEKWVVEYDFSPNYILLLCIGTLWILLIILSLLSKVLITRFDIKILAIVLPMMDVLLIPALKIMQWFERLLERMTPDETPSAEDEIMSFVEDDDEDGGEHALEEDEKRMIKGIFDLDDAQVREIMTPRVDLAALPNSATVAEAREKFIESGHSRIPVYHGTIDEIKGVLYAKDFLSDSANDKTLDELAHHPLFVPDSKNVSSLLKEFKNSSIHVAIIIDEYGGTSGVVTLEDILEKIVGEIRDEYDDEEEGESIPEVLEDGSIIFEARTLISKVNDYLDIDIPDDENVDTIGGFTCREFGRIPEVGETLQLEDIALITVVEADQRKIISVKIKAMNDE
ncbi:MAG: hemolysin family protein [Victivallaceae bacterium]|nr:hemolysin family protein [Victivallaceae bacterium]